MRKSVIGVFYPVSPNTACFYKEIRLMHLTEDFQKKIEKKKERAKGILSRASAFITPDWRQTRTQKAIDVFSANFAFATLSKDIFFHWRSRHFSIASKCDFSFW